MADGTLRLTVDISPQDAQDAFKLFGLPDQPMAITRLTVEASKQSMQEEIVKPKGGEISRLAAMWCKEPKFWEWLRYRYYKTSDCDPSEVSSRNEILAVCGIDSRSELDNSDSAAEAFHKYFRIPYSEWLKTNG
jgi:hypothetical protein